MARVVTSAETGTHASIDAALGAFSGEDGRYSSMCGPIFGHCSFAPDLPDLQQASWMPIQRHTLVKDDASPDDPELEEYWGNRRRRRVQAVGEPRDILSLAYRQRGLCPRCGLDLIDGAGFDPDDVQDWVKWFTGSLRAIHVHHLTYRSKGGSDHRATWS